MRSNLAGAGGPPGAPASRTTSASGDSRRRTRSDDDGQSPNTGRSGLPGPRAVGWVITVALAAIIGNYVIPAVHSAFAVAACYGKYAFTHKRYAPQSHNWKGFGVTWVSRMPDGGVLIRPAPSQGPADEWFGAVLPVTAACNYTISLNAELIGPRDRADVRFYGYGYGIGVRGTAINGIPVATTVQFDPSFGGLRLVPIPAGVNEPGFNATPFPNVKPGVFHRWTISVSGTTAYVAFDGKGYQALHLTNGDAVLVRVWNSQVIIKNVVIVPSRPTLP